MAMKVKKTPRGFAIFKDGKRVSMVFPKERTAKLALRGRKSDAKRRNKKYKK